MNEMVQFQKDMALTGASLILLYLAWTVEDRRSRSPAHCSIPEPAV